jgi:hypothetical protein
MKLMEKRTFRPLLMAIIVFGLDICLPICDGSFNFAKAEEKSAQIFYFPGSRPEIIFKDEANEIPKALPVPFFGENEPAVQGSNTNETLKSMVQKLSAKAKEFETALHSNLGESRIAIAKKEMLSALESIRPRNIPEQFDFWYSASHLVKLFSGIRLLDKQTEVAADAKIVELANQIPFRNSRESFIQALGDLVSETKGEPEGDGKFDERVIEIFENIPRDRTLFLPLIRIFEYSQNDAIRNRSFELLYQILAVYEIRHLGQMQPHYLIFSGIRNIVRVLFTNNIDFSKDQYLKLHFMFQRWLQYRDITFDEKNEAVKILTLLAKDLKNAKRSGVAI